MSDETPPASGADGSVQIQLQVAKRITFASQQNDVPTVREIRIENTGEDTLESLQLRLSSDPDFLETRTWAVDRITPDSSVHLDDLSLKLSGQFLMGLTEALKGTISVSLWRGDEQLATASEAVDLLSKFEWGGTSSMPELLAAFSLPNDRAIDRLLKKTSSTLRSAGRDALLDGYSSGERSRVWEQAAGLWAAVVGHKLDYALPPASFETEGQKIRLPSEILDGGVSTCLDTTLLFAAALEQMGLNPVVVFTQGHAFVGFWLQPEQFRDLVTTDASSVRKRIDLKELVVLETTLATQGVPTKFSEAIKQGAAQLAIENESKFICLVDIRRARMQSVTPLPTQAAVGESGDEQAESIEIALEVAPQLPAMDVSSDRVESETPETRFDRWQRKLLDLTLRNRLLNFKPTKKTISLICPDPARLEDLLADGKKITISNLPELTNDNDGRSRQVHLQRTGRELREEYANQALERNEVVSGLDERELETRLIELFRTARNDIQEGGSNTLYLALGFLSWCRDDNEDRRYRAPLILIPVTLERKSVRSGVKLSDHDDESRFNPTLLQMLKQDFELEIPGVSGDLPADDSGLDVGLIWNIVRSAVRDVVGFEVVEDVALGIFSFAKYLMWKDLVDRTDQLKANDVVRHLIETPRDPYHSEGAFPDESRLDEDFPPDSVFAPLPADGSQLSAMLACAQGKDFVLFGPPGTGKSQTIANMIAHCLADGQKVLFVSEKIAALGVVYRRLDKLGLADFCLELHSNKARKTETLQQLDRAWQSSERFEPAEWQRLAAEVGAQKRKLNSFVQTLHKRHANMLTPYIAMGQIAANPDLPRVELSWPNMDHHSRDDMEAMLKLISRIEVDLGEVGDSLDSEFRLVETDSWSAAWQQKLRAQIVALRQSASILDEASNRLIKKLSLDIEISTRDDISALQSMCNALLGATRVPVEFAASGDARRQIESLSECYDHLKGYAGARDALSINYQDGAETRLDLDALRQEWTEANEASWFGAFLKKRRVKKALKQEAGKQKFDPDRDLQHLVEMRDRRADIDKRQHGLEAKVWRQLDSDLDTVSTSLQVGKDLNKSINALAGTPERLLELRSKIRTLLTDGVDLLEDGPLRADLDAVLDASSAFYSAEKSYLEVAGSERLPALPSPWLSHLVGELNALQEHEGKLQRWCSWRSSRKEALRYGLAPLIASLEDGSVAPSDLEATFRTNYARWWINLAIDSADELRTFVAPQHERDIADFCRLDDDLLAMTRQYIRAKLCAELPDRDEVTRSSEYGVLRRELEKKRRHKPLRQLFCEIPTALPQLTPCLLMSPLSIAQYLPADYPAFDVVIFDEASQITTWDAVGAIARGRRVVVVGDPKQLPPTSFFNKVDDDSDEDGSVEEDLESILDECLGASLPQRDLRWHYRSRNEGLIAFSNQHYYQGKLITFPSPLTDDRSVRYVHVPDGVYEKGGSRTNRGEAEAVADEVLKRLQNAPQKTLAVVTFNSEQQRLIEDLLDRARSEHPEIEPYFSDSQTEPVIVKNLESVQGDERDIVLFSIGYGPDATGAVSMNFGPLNRQGGERRLNVAITRAREELLVFATLRSEQMDLSRTQAIGVRDLKHFLEYAELGKRALAEAVMGSVGDPDSPFEEAVADALRARGWNVRYQIGVSSFRIDLGVVHPSKPGVYLAGVECDGATYHRSATARDRDKLRESVLRGLGWEILRVWSTDWFIDPRSALERIDSGLRELLENETPDEEPPIEAVHTTADNFSDSHSEAEQSGLEGSDDVQAPADTLEGSSAEGANQEEINSDLSSSSSDRGIYRIATFEEFESDIDPERFFDDAYSSILSRMVEHVVDVEGPILLELLAQRVARAHGFARTGAKIAERIRAIVSKKRRFHREDDSIFFWPLNASMESLLHFRHAASPEIARAPAQISLPELRLLAGEVVKSHPEDAAAEMASQMGLSRLRATTRKRLERAVQLAMRTPQR